MGFGRWLVVGAVAAAATAGATDVTVEVTKDRHAIADGVYGVTKATDAQLKRMGVGARRLGGQDFSRFNFKNGVSNEGGDGKYFRNTPFGANYADQLITNARNAGADAVVELPMLGWISNDTSNCSYDVARFPGQSAVSGNCGSGRTPDGGMINGANPADTSLAVTAEHSKQWVQQLVGRFGLGGVRYYQLGNQPALWHVTHHDVHPQPSSYSEIRQKFIDHASAVKSVDPQALTMGPAAWGWLEYFDSASGDRAASGDFVPWYLKLAAEQQQITGHRMLDFLDLHTYPQAPGVTKGETSPPVIELRYQSTRILWDPNYHVESWETCCGDPVQRILPRAKEWIAQSYPGTRLAVSQYAWGALDHYSGALAQVMVLGVFGREGVELAALDEAPADGTIGEDAFKLYRNFDGNGGRYGNISVRASSADDHRVDAYAAEVKPNHYTVVLVNKDPGATEVKLKLADTAQSGSFKSYGFGAGSRLGFTAEGAVKDGVAQLNLAPSTASLVDLVLVGEPPKVAVDGGSLPEPGTPGGGEPTPKPKTGCSATGLGANATWVCLAFAMSLFLNRKKSGGLSPRRELR